MLIILASYLVLVWVLFSKLKLVRWNAWSGFLVTAVGALILAIFVALFNYLTPSGGVVVVSRVVEVTPNVSGQIVEIPVAVNTLVKKGAVLFQIERAPFQFRVSQLEATLVQTKQQALQLRANFQQATANVEGLTKLVAFYERRLKDFQTLVAQSAQAEFKLQEVQSQYDTARFQLQAAESSQLSAKLALDSEINGINTAVASTEAQLASARWELDQTTVRAPADGYVTVLALAIGDRALQARSIMSFIVADDVVIVGMFAPNGFQTIKPGAEVRLVIDNFPGQIFKARITSIPLGVGQGQIAVSGVLARVGSIGGAQAYPAQISIPAELDVRELRLGMPGTATVFADNAGVIGKIKMILVWISAFTAYL